MTLKTIPVLLVVVSAALTVSGASLAQDAMSSMHQGKEKTVQVGGAPMYPSKNIIQNAQSKLQRKGCDLILANDVSRADIGFDSDNNQVTLCNAGGQTEELPKLSKRELAALIIQRCLALRSCPPPHSGS
jgi:phosphopantothenoylcysteine synthetase/decarboxylase